MACQSMPDWTLSRWPMPDDLDFCFQVDDHFYAAGSVRREYREQQEVSHC